MPKSLEREKNYTRPKKSDARRRQRQKLHRKRLVALGMPEEKLKRMLPGELRELLRRPLKLKKDLARAASKTPVAAKKKAKAKAPAKG